MHDLERIKVSNRTAQADVHADRKYAEHLGHRRNLVAAAEAGSLSAQQTLANGPVVYHPPGHPDRTY